MIRRGIFGVVVLVSLAAGGFQAARAQHWTQSAYPFGGKHFTTYFMNVNVGFAFEAGVYSNVRPDLVGVPPRLQRTTDGGVTWTAIPFFDSLGCSITQLSFVSLQHGYASTTNLSGVRNSGIYETVDQGANWKKITPGGLIFSGVYATSGTIFASEINYPYPYLPGGINGEILFSYDDGSTWDSITQVSGINLEDTPQFQWIYGNRDSLVATVYFTFTGNNYFGSSYLVYSNDLGKSWQSSALDQNYQWGTVALHISPHSCNIIRQFLDSLDLASQAPGYPGSDTWSFLEASPPYVNWNPSLMHLETGAWIAGNSCAMYLSYAGQDSNALGLLQRSENGGTSWEQLGSSYTYGLGPDFNEIDDADYKNLSVVGYGAVVYAASSPDYSSNGLWKTTDGGDGTLSASILAPRLEFGHGVFTTGNDTLTLNTFCPSSLIVYYQNISCAITKLDSISITGLSPSEYSLTTTHHNDCLSLPDTTYVTFKDIPAGTYPVTLNANFIDDEYNTIDTSLNVTLIVNSNGSPIPLSLYFKPSIITAAAGDTLEIPVYLSGNAVLGSTSITLPFGIDTNVLRPIGFKSATPRLTNDTIIYLNGAVNVPLQSDSITLNGETLIGYLRCIVYLADTLATTVTLQNASLSSVNAPCVALSFTTGSVNILINGCGDQTLLQFMKTGMIPLGIQSILPNPSTDAVQINFINPTSSAISYQVFDVLGTVRAEGLVDDRSSGGTSLTLDVQTLANGLYYLRARNAATGFAASGKFVVER